MAEETQSQANTLDVPSLGQRGVVVIDRVPDGHVILRLLLVSGSKSDIALLPTDTVKDAQMKIFEAWPREWSKEIPDSPSNLRLLLQGKFLEERTTLEGNKIPVGQVTTVHLLVKNGQTSAESGGEKPEQPAQGVGRCRCCSLM
ncbi:ubiquitin-2 like Rad60 SUMO-like-domain-containing protein [Cladochytrium replicatum]|nr:ubiquitin-2 like Rad60 SUMO-like-domain-containing protein [Cladochytrium replicatum]